MFDQIPVHVWLILLIAIWALPAAQYVVWHIRSSPAGRDITQPQEDLSWRTPKALLRSIVTLVVLGATAVFIFTPYAERMAQHPRFAPILMAGFGAWAFYSVARGIFSGKIQPFIRGVSNEYDRQSQPKRYWASLVWNGVLGAVVVLSSYLISAEATTQSAKDRCYSNDANLPLSSRNEACSDLIAMYDSSIRDDPSDHDAYLNRGLIRLDAMEYDLALADFDRAHQLDPTDAYPLANRGMAHAWKGQTDEASSDFARARSIDPNNPVVMRGEVLLAMNLADFDLAVERATQALARHPDDHWTLMMRADAYRRLGDHRNSDSDIIRANLLVTQANSP